MTQVNTLRYPFSNTLHWIKDINLLYLRDCSFTIQSTRYLRYQQRYLNVANKLVLCWLKMYSITHTVGWKEMLGINFCYLTPEKLKCHVWIVNLTTLTSFEWIGRLELLCIFFFAILLHADIVLARRFVLERQTSTFSWDLNSSN